VILGFLSDAHGNREAFDQGIGLLRSSGADSIYFLGDAVGYLPGDSVLEAIRTSGAIPILGNHDANLLGRQIDPGRDHIFRLGDTLRTASATNLQFLATWPDHRELESQAGSLLLVHGSPADHLGGYIYPDSDMKQFSTAGTNYLFTGQTHRPFVRRGVPTTIINVGSCGLPRDCGDLGAVCVFDDATGEAEIIRFDIEVATRAALDRCGPVAPEVLSVFARRSADCGGA
jgi:predicted phosphodiesterase